MIEWLGIGVRGRDHSWIVRGVSARMNAPELTAIVAADAAAPAAMLDAATGRIVAHEGRVWVGGVPVMPETRRRVQSLLADIALGECSLDRSGHDDARSGGWRRFAPFVTGMRVRQRASEGETARARAKTRLARALAPRPAHVLVRDVDTVLTDADAAEFLTALRRIVRAERVAAVVTCRSLALAHVHADRLLVLADARVLLDGVPRAADDQEESDRAAAPVATAR